MITQETAKNPNPRTKVKCTKCKKQFTFSDESVIEEPLPYPHNTVVEGLLVCPHCGLKSHSYYMPERVRFDLAKLDKAIEQYHRSKSSRDFNTYRKLHESYKHNFDNAQKKYKELMATVEVSNGKPTK